MSYNDIINHIKPADSNNGIHTSLNGVVVTPFNQNYRKQESRGFDLIEILNNENVLSQFKKHTFPSIEKTSTGNIFITPVKRVMSSTENYCIKWLIFNKDFTPVHNHNYPMVPLPANGFLMKIVVPITKQLDDFIIEYIVDYHNIQVQFENSIANVTQVESQVIDGQNSIQVSQNSKMVIVFDISEYSEIMKLVSNRTEFFNNYLSDIDNVL